LPLKQGGKKAVQANIAELYHANESKPVGKKRGRGQIIAIAFAAAKRKKAAVPARQTHR
jgi:hypothetical protein